MQSWKIFALQHCNFRFFNISEIGVTETAVQEVGLKHVIPCVFQSKIGALVSSSVSSSAAQTLKSERVILCRIYLSLIQNKLCSWILNHLKVIAIYSTNTSQLPTRYTHFYTCVLYRIKENRWFFFPTPFLQQHDHQWSKASVSHCRLDVAYNAESSSLYVCMYLCKDVMICAYTDVQSLRLQIQ